MVERDVKRPTIKDVARQSGFSLSTVSLVINNRGAVSRATRESVLKVVADLGYHPTRAARGLASRTSGNIGFILTEDHFSQAEPFYTRIFLGTEFEARTHHYYILLTTVGNEYAKSDTPRFLLEHNVDGIIIAGKVNRRLMDQISGFGVPVVLVDYQVRRPSFSAVLSDSRGGAHQAVAHLLAGGRQAVAFIAGDIEHPSIGERHEGFREAMIEHGRQPEEALMITDEPEPRVAGGASAIERLWSGPRRPDAVFAANDAMAIGCMQWLKQQGVRIPEDVAIVGFDDIDSCLLTEPMLSSVRVLKEEMGKLAVQQLVQQIQTKSQTVVTTHVPVELIVRQSSAGLPQAQADRPVAQVLLPQH